MQSSAESKQPLFVDFSNDTLGPGDVWIFVGCARSSQPYCCSPGFRVHSYFLENSRFEADLKFEKERAAANGEESGRYHFVLHNDEDEDCRLDTVPVFRSLINPSFSVYDDLDGSKLVEFHTTVYGLLSLVYGKPLEIDWTYWMKILTQATQLQVSPLVGNRLEKILDGFDEQNQISEDVYYHCSLVLNNTIALQSNPLLQEVRRLNNLKRQPQKTNRVFYNPSPDTSSASMDLVSTLHASIIEGPDEVVTPSLCSTKPKGTLSSASMELSTPLDTTIISSEWQGPQWTQSSVVLPDLERDEQTDGQTDMHDDDDTDQNEIHQLFSLPFRRPVFRSIRFNYLV